MGILIIIVVAILVGILLVSAIFLDKILNFDNMLDDFKNDEDGEII